MNIIDCTNYIMPYVKQVAKKSSSVLLLDDLLVIEDIDSSRLCTMRLPQQTQIELFCKYDDIKDFVDGIISNIANDYRIYYNLIEKYNRFTSMINPLLDMQDINADEDISQLLRLKSGDGLSLYNLNNYIIPFFYGLLPMTKLDKLGIKIFPLDDISNIAKYTVEKKRLKVSIDIYIRLMKL